LFFLTQRCVDSIETRCVFSYDLALHAFKGLNRPTGSQRLSGAMN
jgi:hypothetical protein